MSLADPLRQADLIVTHIEGAPTVNGLGVKGFVGQGSPVEALQDVKRRKRALGPFSSFLSIQGLNRRIVRYLLKTSAGMAAQACVCCGLGDRDGSPSGEGVG